MGQKYSELLNMERLRPLWQRTTAKSDAQERAAADAQERDGAAELGAPQLAVEPPHAVLDELVVALGKTLGGSAALLGHLLHPLRAAVGKIDPKTVAPASHPMQKAASGSAQDLIDRLDDALEALIGMRR